MKEKTNIKNEFRLISSKENDGYVEAIVQLQSNIDLSSIDNKIKVIGVTSAYEDEGKSTLACNLANIYAAKGFKVLLIDLDLRKPVDHRFYRIEKEPGVVEVCAGKCKLEDAIKKENGVDVLASGESTPFPTQVISSEAFKAVIKRAREEYDYIIVDNPPVLVVTDAIVAGQLIDGYVLVARHRVSKYSALREAIKIFKNNNLRIIGCTIVDMKFKGRKPYYYYKSKNEK